MIRAVFFDLYGTLAVFDPPVEEVQAAACREFGLEPDAKGVARGYDAADAFMAEQNGVHPLRGMSDGEREAFFGRYERIILQGAGLEVSLELAAAIWRRVRQLPYEMVLYSDALPTLAELRSQGLLTGVISNMNRDSVSLLHSMGLEGAVDVAVTSGDVGAEKPHAPIFLAALERAGVAAQEAIYVGDQVSSDVEGSRAVGMMPVLIDRNDRNPAVDCLRIRALPEVREVVARHGPGRPP